MWSDKELDEAFRRLGPPQPEAEPFPLDAWLRLETQLDKQLMEREFRRRLWRFFAAEMLVVAVGALLWLAWPRQSQVASSGSSEAPASGAARATGVNGPTADTAPATRSHPQKAGTPPASSVTSAAANGSGAADAAVAAAPASSTGPNHSIRATNAGAGPARPAPGSATPFASGGAAGPAGLAVVAAGATPDSAVSASRRSGHVALARLVAAKRQPSKAARTPAGREHSAGARPKQLAYAAARAKAPRTAGSRTGRASTKSHGEHLAASPVTARATNGGHGEQPGLATSHFKPTTFPPAGTTPVQSAAVAPATRGASAVIAATASSSPDALVTTDLSQLQPLPVALHTGSPTALPTPLATLPLVVPPLPEPFRQPRFYLGVLAAPDVSTVKMADYQAPTPNLGLLLEYRLTSRLRVNTGLLRSTKQYRARKQDYDWSYYPVALLGNFEWVDGRCTILDVPVNLRYDVLARPRYQLFGSAGLSSLFMQREAYAYDYEYYGQLHRWESSFTNENQHWLSVLNLSAGYERNLGRHWRLQAEPYLKLPLGGVGAGKVRLMSGGVFFGVKYGL